MSEGGPTFQVGDVRTEDYLEYWRAEAPVFLRPASPGGLYTPPSRTPALLRLVTFWQRNQALVLIAGEPGTGKTTLLQSLLAQLPTATHEILVTTMVRREREAGWLTPRIAELMGVPSAGGLALPELIRATAAKMDELIAEKRQLVVAVDAAHLMDGPDALGEVVAFLNLQSLAGTCLSFVLCGDPGLVHVVQGSPELASKLAFTLSVAPLAQDETSAYLAHRLGAAGVTAVFEPDAIALIHARSKGVLAQINAYAETCLVEACLKQARRVTIELARSAGQHAGGAAAPALRTSPNPFTTTITGFGHPASSDSPAKTTEKSAPKEPQPAAEAAAAAGDGPPIRLNSLFKSGGGRKT